jgi:hypothetical protein
MRLSGGKRSGGRTESAPLEQITFRRMQIRQRGATGHGAIRRFVGTGRCREICLVR